MARLAIHTPWFKSSVRPARPGMYQRRFKVSDWCSGRQYWAWWDGKRWRANGSRFGADERPRSSYQVGGSCEWRGLAQEPRK